MKILRYAELAWRGLGELREGLARREENPFARPLAEALWGRRPVATLLGIALAVALAAEALGPLIAGVAPDLPRIAGWTERHAAWTIAPVFALVCAARVRRVLFREADVLRAWVAQDERRAFEALALPLVSAGLGVVLLATLAANTELVLQRGAGAAAGEAARWSVRLAGDLAREWPHVAGATGAARAGAWVSLACAVLGEGLLAGALYALAVASLCGTRAWATALVSVLWRGVGFGFSVKGVLILLAIVNGVLGAILLGVWMRIWPDVPAPRALGAAWEDLDHLAVLAVLCAGVVGGLWSVGRASLEELLREQHVDVLAQLDALVDTEDTEDTEDAEDAEDVDAAEDAEDAQDAEDAEDEAAARGRVA